MTNMQVNIEFVNWAKRNLSAGCTFKQLATVLQKEGHSVENILSILSLAKKQGIAISEEEQKYNKAASILRMLADLHYKNQQNLYINKEETTDKTYFFANYWTANKPVVLKNFVNGWGKEDVWGIDNLSKTYGDIEIEVQTGREADKNFELNSIAHKTKMPMRSYCKMIKSVENSNDFYMTANNQIIKNTKLGELLNNVNNLPEFINKPSINGMWHLWIGPKGTITPLHHDENCIVHAQIIGRKKWKLISPLSLPDLYNHQAVFSQVDIEDIDYRKFPFMRNVKILEVIVNSGDALFVPLGWWHGVVALDKTVSLQTTDFVFENTWNFKNPTSVSY